MTVDKKVIITKNIKSAMAGKEDLLFYIFMIAFPVMQFVIFYIIVNFNSYLLAFKQFNIAEGTVIMTTVNVKRAFTNLFTDPNILSALKMSFIYFILSFIISTPLGLLFSFYIYKKMPLYGFFRVLLYLPSIISAIVMVMIYQYFVERALPAFMLKLFDFKMIGLLENRATRVGTILFYNIWAGFGSSILMYVDCMSRTSPEVIESGHLDGAVGFKEFIYIIFPSIYDTYSTLLIASVAGLFIGQYNLFSFYGTLAPEDVQSFGYFLFSKTLISQDQADYPILSAYGIMITLVAVPLTFLVKHLMYKIGPSED